MPVYDFYCPGCGWEGERTCTIEQRDKQYCENGSYAPMKRRISSALFKFTGRVTPGGGPDRFTADMLGIPLKELPDGLKVDSK